jgi:hypothetical protein
VVEGDGWVDGWMAATQISNRKEVSLQSLNDVYNDLTEPLLPIVSDLAVFFCLFYGVKNKKLIPGNLGWRGRSD